jgi:hypothetical protein
MAYSLLAGIQQNYYHGLFFVLARLDPLLIRASWGSGSNNPALLLPSRLGRRPAGTG